MRPRSAVVLPLLAALSVSACTPASSSHGSSKLPTTAVERLKAGTCFGQTITSNRIQYSLKVTSIGCDNPHQFEIVANTKLPAGGAYPKNLKATATKKCTTAFRKYVVAVSKHPDGLGLDTIFPAADQWKHGERTLICIATPPPSGSSLGLRQGSARGRG